MTKARQPITYARRCLILGIFSLALAWTHCQESTTVGPVTATAVKRLEGAMLAAQRALLNAQSITLPSKGVSAANVETGGAPPFLEENGANSDNTQLTQRFILDGNATRQTKSYAPNDSQSTPLTALNVQRRAQVAKVPCPKKQGNTWILEGAFITDLDNGREGSGVIRISPTGISVEITYKDGKKETVDLQIDKNSPLKQRNYAALFGDVLASNVPELTDKAIQETEAGNFYNVANTRLFSQTTLYALSEGKNGKVLKEIERSSDVIFAKSNEYNTKRNAAEFKDDPKGRFSSLSVLLSTAATKGKGLSIFYTYQSKQFDCPKDGSGDGEVSDDAGPADTTPADETPKPDKAIDCSKYQAGGSFPKWYVGNKKDNKLCQAMYEKLYGQNGQNILCKTDADCRNPCRFLCCGDAGRLEQIICRNGTCGLGVTSKCNFCATGKDGETCKLPDEFKTP